MSALNNSALIGASGSTGYQISRSVRLRSSASAYFNRTYGTPTDGKKWTLSFWLKRGLIGSASYQIMSAGASISDQFHINADSLSLYLGGAYRLVTTQVLRDPSAWYHIVLVIDTSNATADNRNIMYINGVQVTSFSTRSNLSLNATTNLNAASTVTYIGRYAASSAEYTDGYLAEVNFIDGQALTPSSFGETNPVTGVWQPKKYTGTYGTNGFYLNFSDNSAATAAAIGKDYSGNGNNWTPNNISVTAGSTYDSMLDVPTQWADGGNGRGNYATLNPLDKYSATSVTNGNLYTDGAGASGTGTTKGANSTIAVTSGKWYWEVTQNVGSGAYECRVGIWSGSNVTQNVESVTSSRYFYRNPGANLTRIYTGASFTDYASYYGTFTDGDVLMFALDVDSGKMWLGKNGTWFNNAGGAKNPATGTNADWTTLPTDPIFVVATNYQTAAQNSTMNFGQRPFAYTPPSGFKALNTLNLPTPTIANGALYMAATTYTGTGASLAVSNAVNGVSFQPDFVWTKPRSTAVGHTLFDSLRGVTKYLQSNTTGAEGTAATSLTAFNSDGFTVNSDTSTGANGVTYVGWQWKAGGTAVSNTAGSITSSVSANTTSGFSVVTYTGNGTAGATIGHGLGVAPSMMIAKNRSSGGSASYEWTVYHASLGATKAVFLNDTGAAATDAGYWYNTAPTSTLITVPSNSRTNVNGSNFVIYCFAEVPGFSKFGSYTGNGSTDGPFVFCGFRPRFLMTKRTDTTGPWQILDTARDTYNSAVAALFPNTSGAEASFTQPNGIDYLSNGFKLRNSSTDDNANGGTYIFAAFCENPFKNALAR